MYLSLLCSPCYWWSWLMCLRRWSLHFLFCFPSILVILGSEMSYIDFFQCYLIFRPVCSGSSHPGYPLDHPCQIWVIYIYCGFLCAWCLEFTPPSVVGFQIYGVLHVWPSGYLSALGVWCTGRECSRTHAWRFFVVPCSKNLYLCAWKREEQIFHACGFYEKGKDQMIIIFVDLRWTQSSRRNKFF